MWVRKLYLCRTQKNICFEKQNFRQVETWMFIEVGLVPGIFVHDELFSKELHERVMVIHRFDNG